MARGTATQSINTFVAGLITEATELTQPRNSSTDEDNCLLFNEGNRTRRRGVDFESGFQQSVLTSSEVEMRTFAVNTFTWKAVAGDGNRNFACVQMGNIIEFYDLGAGGSLSSNKKSFTVDLNTLKAPSFSAADDIQVEFDAGKGVLFLASSKINPTIVEYDPVGDSITLTDVNIQIRDFAGVDDSLDFDEEPASLTNTHEYNLFNQGWFVQKDGLDVVARYFTSAAVYPPNSLQWFTTKTSTGTYDVGLLRRFLTGNTKSPGGHFIVDAFNIDRTDVSGIGGLTIEAVNNRPAAVAFFAGRTFWAGVDGPKVNGNIYFSQILETLNQAGRCYQVADSTSEDDPILVDTDGGLIVIPEIGSVKKLLPVGASLIVFADNGVWQISGPDEIFRATDFSVKKITTEGVENGNTVVNVAGIPLWWSDSGIISLVADPVSGQLSSTSISENTVQSFYNKIPGESKKFAKGVYDKGAKKVIWLYRSTEAIGIDKFRYDRTLTLDTNIRAFYPWSISFLTTDSPYIASVFETPEINIGTGDVDVVDDTGTLVVDDSGVQVVAEVGSLISISTSLRFLAINPDGLGDTKYTFADFDNEGFLDWESADSVGVGFLSFAETWWELNDDIIRFIQAPYIYIYTRRTETGFIPDGGDGFTLLNPSSLLVTAMWDFANSAKAGKWSRQFQAYKFRQNVLVDPLDLTFDTGYPIVVTRNKIRGKGRAIQLRFESDGQKDFNLIGWGIIHEGNANV